MNVASVQGPEGIGDENTSGPERGDDATKIEVQTLKERTQKNEKRITILSQSVDILGKRLARAENMIEQPMLPVEKEKRPPLSILRLFVEKSSQNLRSQMKQPRRYRIG